MNLCLMCWNLLADFPFLFLLHVVCLDADGSEEEADAEESEGNGDEVAHTTINQ